jgi:hypothetical protein
MASLANHDHNNAVEMRANVNQYKEESARVRQLFCLSCCVVFLLMGM